MSTTTIWNDFNDRLLGFISSRVSNQEDAKDILQDVFIKIHKKASSIKDNNKLTSWVYQITRNTIIDFYRKGKIKQDENIEMPELFTENEEIQKDFTKCLLPFVEELPDKYKEAIKATELGKLSQKEYAEQIGISYSGAKSRVQRAKSMLQEQFSDCCNIQSDKYGNVISSDCEC